MWKKSKIIKRKKGIKIKKLLNPKIDYVFKRIFGQKGSEEITAGLLSSILRTKVKNIKLDCNPILEKDLIDDKIGILDIKAKIENNINCDIEMQVVDRKNIEKRILFYWSKIYSKSIKEGENHKKLQKGIVILISDYEIESLKEIKKYITKWNIREEEYQKIILTDVMEIYIIELPKFNKYKERTKNSTLNSWIKFIESPEVIDMNEKNEEIKKAKNILEEISQDEHEIYLAELREKYIMDQRDIEEAGYDKAIKEVAKNMIKMNIDIDIIIKATGLTKEEIEHLKK